MWSRLMAIAAKEVLHVRRDVRTLLLAIVVPVVLILLFGYGIGFDQDELALTVVDQDQSQASRRFVRELTASGDLRVASTTFEVDDAMTALRRSDSVGALVIPPDFGTGHARVQLLVDGSDGSTATAFIGKATALGGRVMLPPRAPAVRLHLLGMFNPAGRSAWFIVPGLAAYVVAVVAVLLTALTIARELEQGSMQQLFATPVGKVEIVLGKLLPYLGLGILAVALVLGTGFVVFEVPLRGSVLTLVAASLLFLVGMLGQGLLISTVTGNQMVATQVATMSSLLPSMLLSGFIFPIENMPPVLQGITHVVPARYFVTTLRGVLLRGNGVEVLWPQLAALALFAVAVLTLAVKRFSREDA